MSYLPFISDDNLITSLQRVLHPIADYDESSENFYKNAIDPFSALFDSTNQNISLKQWIQLERTRQKQKSLQNRLGEFHQAILGSMYGWNYLVTGKVVDIENPTRKIIAEIKNKHSTVKGSDRIVIYKELEYALMTNYSNYIAYYVEVIPKKNKRYDSIFTPSDNLHKNEIVSNPNIRQIDGVSFYSLASGYPNALQMLYEVLPSVISKDFKIDIEHIEKDPLFRTLFDVTFKSEATQ